MLKGLLLMLCAALDLFCGIPSDLGNSILRDQVDLEADHQQPQMRQRLRLLNLQEVHGAQNRENIRGHDTR